MTLTPDRLNKVRALFEAALAQPTEHRDAFVRDAAAEDADLAEEVASLIAAHEATGDPFSRPFAEYLGFTDDEHPAAALVGRDLGPYRVTREIGRGGMGTVYEAERADEQFTRRVAIKTVRTGSDSTLLIRRFRQERQIQAALSHPNIAALLDAGITEDGIPYLVLEYVEGVPISTYCDERKLPLAARLELMRQVTDAVQHAHRQLVVHRDLKPSNILVTADGTAKLLDFGISKVIDEAAGLTMTEGPSGFTIAYASPEQLRGETISTATDIYSLGTVLFRLLTGRHPFDIEDATPIAAFRAICEDPPPLPSMVATPAAAENMGFGSVQRLRRVLRGELDAIVMMALRKEPDRRYASAHELGSDLDNHLTARPVHARPDSPGYRLRKLIARNRLATAALAFGFLAMAGGTALALWQAREARAHAAVADRERNVAEQVSGFLQSIFVSADASWRGQGTGVGPNTTILEVVDAAADRVDRDLGAQPEVAEALQRILFSTYTTLGQNDKAEARLRDLLRSQQARNADPLDIANGLVDLGSLYYVTGRLDSAVVMLGEAHELYEQAGFPESVELSVMFNQLGLVLLASGRAAEAEPHLARAVSLRRAQVGDDAVAAIAINNLGMARDAMGDLAGAEEQYRTAAELFDRLGDREYFERGAALSNLGVALLTRGEAAEAERVTREALAVFARTIGSDHPMVGLGALNLARIQLAIGSADSALSTLRAGREKLGSLPPEHPNIARAESYEAEILLALGRTAEAERLARHALETRTAAYAAGDWRIAETEGVLGRILLARGDPEALDYLRRSHEVMRAAMGDSHPRTRAAAAALSRAAGPAGS